MVHLSVNTQECRSRCWIGWIIQDVQETRVSRSLTFCLEIKMPWRKKPSRKKKAAMFTNVTANANQSQLNARFSKVCEIFKDHVIESLKYIREFHTPFVILVTFPRPNVMQNESNCDCRSNASWAGLGPWTRPIYSIPLAIRLKVRLRETNRTLKRQNSNSNYFCPYQERSHSYPDRIATLEHCPLSSISCHQSQTVLMTSPRCLEGHKWILGR